ncbi:MAG: MFS transporter [Chloroflexota bacterium]|nr:MFS transporter [Chloroflexota bacterium]
METEIEKVTSKPVGAGVAALPVRSGLTLRTKTLYGVGEVSNAIKSFTFGLLLLFFYTSVLGLPGTLVGIATSISLIWDALVDPVIGHLSDRAHFRFGRRHTFMLAGAVSMGIFFYLIFSPPAGLSMTALFVWLVGTNLLLRTSNSIFMVPYHALGAELSDDYDERTSITGIRAALSLLGTLLVAGLMFVVFFPNQTPGVDPKFNAGGYTSMGIVLGLTITVLGAIAVFGTLSQRSRLPRNGIETQEEKIGFFDGLLLALRNRSFLVLTLATAIFFLASVVNAQLAVHYLTYYAQISSSQAVSVFLLSFYIGGLLGVFVWLRVAQRVDKHRLFVGNTLILAFIISAAYWLVGPGHLLGTGNVMPLLVGNAIGGFFASAIWVVPASMIADVTDEDELKTGKQRSGTFFGINSFFVQESASIAVLITGVLLDYFARLVPGQVEQSAQTAERLGILYGLMPAFLYVMAAVLMLRYSLTRQRVVSIQQELRLKRNGDQ